MTALVFVSSTGPKHRSPAETRGRIFLARRIQRHGFSSAINAAGRIATMHAPREALRCRKIDVRGTRGPLALRGVAGAVGLTLGDLLGETDEHHFGPLVPQQAKIG